jgi:uncharacterized protein YjiS (DUF1127 family)
MSTLPLRSPYAVPQAKSGFDHSSTVVARAVERLLTWRERTRQRRQLQSLSDHMLRDLGLGRADVEAEAGKPFWRL